MIDEMLVFSRLFLSGRKNYKYGENGGKVLSENRENGNFYIFCGYDVRCVFIYGRDVRGIGYIRSVVFEWRKFGL